MARKNSEDENLHQFSLDAFSNAGNSSKSDNPNEESSESDQVPAMPDLDNNSPQLTEQSSDETDALPIVELNPLRSFDMPSSEDSVVRTTPKTKLVFHDLEKMYPHPPMKDESNGLVIHRAVLHDLTGVGQLMDWLSDDHGAIVEMGRLMKREVEFSTALKQLNQFVEGDLGGQIIQITDSRLMFLPPGCRGVKGVDTEAFAADADDLGQRRL
jgi:SepF-like predicted cell division protein (DUF552 family)